MPPEEINAKGAVEWFRYARSDFFFAETKIEEGLFETNCYHAQQCVEKALKAVCVIRGIPFTYTHDLLTLMQELYPDALDRPAFAGELKKINGYAVSGRYPGFDEPVTEDEWREAVHIAKTVLEWAEKIIR